LIGEIKCIKIGVEKLALIAHILAPWTRAYLAALIVSTLVPMGKEITANAKRVTLGAM
jgi:hypothetical protein